MGVLLDAVPVTAGAKPAITDVLSLMRSVPAAPVPPQPYSLNVAVCPGPMHISPFIVQLSGLAVWIVANVGPKGAVTLPSVYIICTLCGPVALTCEFIKSLVTLSSVAAPLVIVKKTHALVA
jgi:hypothetical protein